MEIESPDFSDGDVIPDRFTCAGADVSPRLRWSDVPEQAEELLLIVDDPDAPGGLFIHWVLGAIDPGRTSLDEGEVPEGSVEGANDFGKIGYSGPCPPVGHGEHTYNFTLYALAQPLMLKEGDTAEVARVAARGSVLEEAKLTCRYTRGA
jgi:Raf kinase inhibitor-like YbhB/YbcL family protein